MNSLISIIIRLSAAILAGLIVIGITLDLSDNDLIIGSSGIVSSVLIWYLLRNRTKKDFKEDASTEDVIDDNQKESSSNKAIHWGVSEGRPYRFIFTHEEEALDAIEGAVESHPKVESVAQDAGNWYSNGETGPEWFSMHVRCKAEDSDEVQEFVRQQLREKSYGYKHINFIGDYN